MPRIRRSLEVGISPFLIKLLSERQQFTAGLARIIALESQLITVIRHLKNRFAASIPRCHYWYRKKRRAGFEIMVVEKNASANITTYINLEA